MIDTKGDGVTRRWSLHVTGVALGCVLAGGLLAGCSAEQEASGSLPSSSATPTTEEELPPLGPEDLPMPDEARTQDAAGAEAFVRYYIELINRTSDVMDAAPLRQFSDETCQDCQRIANKVGDDAARGYDYEGGGITLTTVGAPLLADDRAEMALGADLSALSVADSSGEPVEGLSAPAFTGLTGGAAVRWDSDRVTWIITGLTLR